jgi:UDP-3-O-[3-hydroxymyristoyl] glucosamine N-acyltransferase
MILYDNGLPVKILGYGVAPEEMKTVISAEGIAVECVDGDQAMLAEDYDRYQYLIGRARNMLERKKLADWIRDRKVNAITYLHPTTVTTSNSKIGHGVFSYPYSFVLDAEVSDHVIISGYTAIPHGAYIGEGTVFMPYSHVVGSVVVGKFCGLQMRSSVCDKVRIECDYVNLLPNTIVTKDITKSGTYGGIPARWVNGTTTLTNEYYLN